MMRIYNVCIYLCACVCVCVRACVRVCVRKTTEGSEGISVVVKFSDSDNVPLRTSLIMEP